jgi:hypothetical protein
MLVFLFMDKIYLENVYQNTKFIVYADGEVIIRIEESNAHLDKLLDKYGVKKWAFITAYNPASKQLSKKENKKRQEELLRHLDEKGFKTLHGAGVPEEDGWNQEISLFVLNINPDQAKSIGKKFGQNAILVGEVGKPAKLLWCT